MLSSCRTPLAALSLLLLTATAHAQTLDGAAFARSLEALYQASGYQLRLGAQAVEGDTITVQGFKISLPDVPEFSKGLAINTPLVFEGVSQDAEGVYTARSMAMGSFTLSPSDSVTVTVDGATLEGLRVPSGEISIEDTVRALGSARIGPISTMMDGKEVLGIQAITTTAQFGPGPGLTEVTGTAGVEGISIDLSGIKDADLRQATDFLGIQTLTGSFAQDVRWNLETGQLVVDKMLTEIDQLGSLDLRFDLGGYTMGFIEQLQASQEDVSALMAQGKDDEAETAQAKVGVLALAQLSVNSADIRYEDNAFVGPLLDLMAERSGTTRAAIIANSRQSLEALMAYPGFESLAERVLEAVDVFLADPKSFEIGLKPAQALKFMDFAAAGAAPGLLLDGLGITVAANASRSP